MKTLAATGIALLLSIVAVTTPSEAAVAPATDTPITSVVTVNDGEITAHIG